MAHKDLKAVWVSRDLVDQIDRIAKESSDLMNHEVKRTEVLQTIIEAGMERARWVYLGEGEE